MGRTRRLIGLDIGSNCVKAIELTQAGSETVLTGYGQAEDVRQAIAAGFDAHATKPVNVDQLLALLELRAEPLTGARRPG